jgi:hypothetical protein
MYQILSILAIVLAAWLALMEVTFFRPRRRAAGRDDLAVRGVEWMIYLLFLLALAAMALSGILMLAIGQRMDRWMLILHMTFAPLFAICITALALLWAETNSSDHTSAGARIAFWLVILSGFVTIVTALLGMMTWFGSAGQEILLNLHRTSSMVLLIAATYQAARLLAPSTARQS